MRIAFNKCIEIINNATNIALFCHTRPDGDTLSSALALKLGLLKLNKFVDIFCDELIPEKFKRLGFDTHFSTQFNKSINYDLLIAIDCGDITRVGFLGNSFVKHRNTLAIDHHITHEDFAKNTYLVGFSSTCEIILSLINGLDIDLDDQIASVLFVGLSTDTGNFRHNNTNEATFNAAKQLATYNVDIANINMVLYNETTFARQKLLGRALSNMRSYFDGKLCMIIITSNDFKETFTDMSYTEGFTDYAINVNTAQIGICISQSNKNTYKVSMRSKKVNVAEICSIFGGGGHALAAGCVICGFMEDVIDKIIRAVEDIKWTDL